MRLKGYVIVTAVLALTCSLCWAQRITEEQAAEAVRAFEGDPNLQFRRIEVYENDEGPEWSHYEVYTLEAGDWDNEIADYSVDTTTGEVEGVTYYLHKQHPLKEVGEPLPQEQCRQVAEDYARAKYRDFDSMGYRLQEQSLGERVRKFVWRQVLDYEAVSMNYVEVEVRAADGRIQGYDCERYPVVRPQQPSVSSQQAVQIAMRAAGITDMMETPDTALRVDPLGVTYWTVVIQGLNAEGFDVCYYVRVECRTGEVLECQRTDYGRPDDYGEDPEDGPPVTPPAVVSPHQARDAVRAFEGNQDLVLICRKLDSFTDGPVWYHKWYYDIEDRDSDDHSWDVDAVTGEVTRFIDHSAYPGEDTDEPTGRLTAEECREFAERYVRAKFRGFDEMDFVLDEPEWDRHGWSFWWREKVACEPCISSHVGADVNPEDGRIQNYGASRVPEFTPYRPRISAEQAVELARASARMVRLLEEPEPALYAYPQATIWGFEVRGPDEHGEVHHAIAEVDAVSGEVIGIYFSMGVGGNTDPSEDARVIGEQPLAPIRELVAKVPFARVHWLGKDGAVIVSGRNRYALLPGSDTIEWTGGQIKLSQKTVLQDGRLMVPPELVQALVKALLPPTSPEEPSDE